MEVVQLWGLQDVYDYVYESILDPVWEFVSSCISTGFTYLANGISVALNAVLNSIFGEIISIFLDWFYAKWFALQCAILLLLDCIEDCFNVVSGLRPVYIRSGGGTGPVSGKGMPILLAVFQQKPVQNSILVMIAVGFWLCFAMAILATARNFLELGGDQTKPVTHIIKMTAKSLLYLVLAPFTAVALILLSQAILTTIDRGLTEGEGKTSVARIIFCISSLDAIDTSIISDGAEYNVSYEDGPTKASLTDKYRAEYYYEDDHFILPNFCNPIKARLTFTFWGFDYFISLGCGIFFTVIMCMVLAVFIGRIFDVVVLLIIEPFFVAMMPFDDGEYYKKWFELFLGKLFQGFGSVIGMRVYLMILEQLFAGNISFSNSNSLGARLQDYLIMLLFAMGGGVAVQHVGPLVTGILSQGAASGEQAYAAAGGAVGKYIANKEMGVVKKAAQATASKIGGGLGMGLSKFMGKRGGGGAAPGGAGAAGAGGAAGEIGKFFGMRPQGAQGGKPGAAGAAIGPVSAMQQSLSSVKTSVMGAGLINNNPSGTGKDKDKKAPGSGSGNKGVNMNEVLKSSGKGSDVGSGEFKGGSKGNGDNKGGSSGGKPPVKGNMGGSRRTMQDMVGQGESQDPLNTGFIDDGDDNGSFTTGSGSRGSSKTYGSSNTYGSSSGKVPPAGGNTGSSQKTMQDVVGNNRGSRGTSGSGPKTMENILYEDQGNDDLNTGFIDDGYDEGSFTEGSGNRGGSSNRGSGSTGSGSLGSGSTGSSSGTRRTMQDMVGSNRVNSGVSGSGPKTMDNILYEDSENGDLNTGFIDDGYDEGSFTTGSGSTGGGYGTGSFNTGSGSGSGSYNTGSGSGTGSYNTGSYNTGSSQGMGSGSGTQRSMQDLVGNSNGNPDSGPKSMQDLLNDDDDPLNSGFINDDDDGAF